jgi:hypothetical protein
LVAYVEPCARCGWKFDTFHVCLDLPPEVMRKVEEPSKPKRKRSTIPSRDPRSDAYRGSEEWKDNLRSAANERWRKQREHDRSRDKDIVRRYSEANRTYRELAVEFGLSYPTIARIVQEAGGRGEVAIRPAAKRIRS